MSNSAYTPNTGVKAPINPGWNDPPKLSYNAQSPITPNRPRNILNKRVAFPLSSSASSSPAVISSGNPPPKPIIFTPPQSVHNATSTQDEIVLDSEETLDEVKVILLNLLDTSPELGNKGNDIRKRIEVMENMWTTGKLNNEIYLQMKMLTQALSDDNPTKADDIHRELMIDHVSAVGTWMPGIKQLIHHCVARSELLSIDKD